MSITDEQKVRHAVDSIHRAKIACDLIDGTDYDDDWQEIADTLRGLLHEARRVAKKAYLLEGAK